MRVTVSSCPHCGKVLDVALNKYSDGPLGPRISVPCRKCGGAIWTGQDEWITFSPSKKRLYFAQVVFSAVFWGLGLGGVALAILYDFVGFELASFAGLAVFAFICYRFTVSTKDEIAASVKRSEEKSKEAQDQSTISRLIPIFASELESIAKLWLHPEASAAIDSQRDRFFGSGIGAIYAGALLVALDHGVEPGPALNRLRYAAIDATIWHSSALPPHLRARGVSPQHFRSQTNSLRERAAAPLIAFEKKLGGIAADHRTSVIAEVLASSYEIAADRDRLRRVIEDCHSRALTAYRAVG